MNYKNEYDRKKMTVELLAEQFCSGWSCCADVAAAIPYAICDAIATRASRGELENLKLHTLLDTRPLSFFSEENKGKLTGVSWFSGTEMRKAVNGGWAELMPGHYGDMPALFLEFVDVDAFIAIVSPMDKHGYFSTGCSGSISAALISKAKRIFLQVDKNMPRALSAPLIHVSQATALCETDEALPILPATQLDDVSISIGNRIAEEIPDGATIQLGFGAIPDAVGKALVNKCHLGIHTEMLTDSMIDLIESGVVDNSKKPLHKGKTVAAFAFGSQRIYDYIDDNPAVEILPVDYVNSTAVISRHPDFISVNSALEVDFYGQVCAESIGVHHISGSGGHNDYVRGAVMSPGGKSFVAFPSTSLNGKVSRILPILTPGATVTTGKNEVDYIVTEYGVAKLRGRTLAQRTKALISIAHPKFRDELILAAHKRNIKTENPYEKE